MTTDSTRGLRIDHASQTVATWAGGTTRTIYAFPAEATITPAKAQVWIGTAAIEQTAAYSFFPGRVRVHMPIHGNGIRLHFRDPTEVVELASFAQHRFDGARPVTAELIDAPITAFNLIVQADVSATAKVFHLDQAEVSLDLDGPAQMTDDMYVLHVVYMVTGSTTIQTARQPAVKLHRDDAFVFHPHAATNHTRASVGLQSLTANATIVVATVTFRPDLAPS